MEKEKKKNNGIYVVIALVFVCLAVGIMYLYKQNSNTHKVTVKSNDRYLTANYSMVLYEKTEEYLEKNVEDIQKLKDNESITIDSKEVMDTTDEEYKYCSGKVIITKLEYGILEHKYESSCENESDENIDFTMRVYTNINQGGEYQLIGGISKNNTGYTAHINDYKLTRHEDSYSTYLNGAFGVIKFDKDFSITDINILTKLQDGVITSLYETNEGYIVIGQLSNLTDETISYYNKTGELIWETKSKAHDGNSFLCETDSQLWLSLFNRITKLNKENGNIEEIVDIKNIGDSSLSYTDGYLYAFDVFGTYKFYKIDLNGNVVSTIDLLKVEGIENTNAAISFEQGSNLSIYKNRDTVYVFDKDGNLVNKLDVDINIDNEKYTLEEFMLNNESYELVYNNGTETHTIAEDGTEKLVEANKKRYIKYDLNNKVLISEDIDETYGYLRLNSMDLKLDDVYHQIQIIDGQVIESLYSPSDNGTQIFMIYDYNK